MRFTQQKPIWPPQSLILLTKPLLSLTALSAEIGGQGVLHDVSLSIPADTCLGIVGGSGAGKSTLLRAIMGLRRPARPVSGVLEFDGKRFDLAAGGRRPRGIAYVPQSPVHGLDPLRRIRWQWNQLVRCKGRDNPDLFAALGLPDPAQRFPHEWSHGMQQRLLLAMALIEEPRLLILDEPTSALDALIAAQVLTETVQLARAKGIAVLMVTHDLALAGTFCDDICILQDGRQIEHGPATQILNAPQHPYAQQLVANRGWGPVAHA